jgi:hypothetical protein
MSNDICSVILKGEENPSLLFLHRLGAFTSYNSLQISYLCVISTTGPDCFLFLCSGFILVNNKVRYQFSSSLRHITTMTKKNRVDWLHFPCIQGCPL